MEIPTRKMHKSIWYEVGYLDCKEGEAPYDYRYGSMKDYEDYKEGYGERYDEERLDHELLL